MPPRTHGQHPVSQVDPIGQMAKFWNPTPHGRRRHHTVIGTYLHGPVPGPQPRARRPPPHPSPSVCPLTPLDLSDRPPSAAPTSPRSGFAAPVEASGSRVDRS